MARTGFEKISLRRKLISVFCVLLIMCIGAFIWCYNSDYVRLKVGVEIRKGDYYWSEDEIAVRNFENWAENIKVDEDRNSGAILVTENVEDKRSTCSDYVLTEPLELQGQEWLKLPEGGSLRVAEVFYGKGKSFVAGPQPLNKLFSNLSSVNNDIFSDGNALSPQPNNVLRLTIEWDDTEMSFYHNPRVEDEKTQYLLNRTSRKDFGYVLNNKSGFEIPLMIYHQSPLTFSFSAYYGEQSVYNFPVNEGIILESEGFSFSLLKIYPVEQIQTERVIQYMHLPPHVWKLLDTSKKSPYTRICIVKSTGWELDIRLITKRGEISASNCENVISFYFYTYNVPIDQVIGLQIRKHPYRQHVVYRLSEFPGLPEANRDIDNLFDVKIDRIELTDSNCFKAVLGHGFQLNINTTYNDPVFPKGYFPKVFCDMTLGDLFNEYIKYIPNRGKVYCNQSYSIEINKDYKVERDGWLNPILKEIVFDE